MEELRRELFYETHKHKLGSREVKDFFRFLETSPRFQDAIEFFVDTWETLLNEIPKLHGLVGEVDFPGIDCIHCDEPILFRDDGENAEFLWLHQGRQKAVVGIEPLTYCPMPYYVIGKIISLHPEWIRRVRSSCNICGEELTFPTNHRCLVPDWIRFTVDKVEFLKPGNSESRSRQNAGTV